jgi:hypothetical protein
MTGRQAKRGSLRRRFLPGLHVFPVRSTSILPELENSGGSLTCRMVIIKKERRTSLSMGRGNCAVIYQFEPMHAALCGVGTVGGQLLVWCAPEAERRLCWPTGGGWIGGPFRAAAMSPSPISIGPQLVTKTAPLLALHIYALCFALPLPVPSADPTKHTFDLMYFENTSSSLRLFFSKDTRIVAHVRALRGRCRCNRWLDVDGLQLAVEP